MTKFIEVHDMNGKSNLINLAQVEQIECEINGRCVIYFALLLPDAIERDYIVPKETYDQIKRKIFGGE